MHERMHTRKKHTKKNRKIEKSRNSKIENIENLSLIPISLHAKFQDNRAIRLGEKRGQTRTQTDSSFIYIDEKNTLKSK